MPPEHQGAAVAGEVIKDMCDRPALELPDILIVAKEHLAKICPLALAGDKIKRKCDPDQRHDAREPSARPCAQWRARAVEIITGAGKGQSAAEHQQSCRKCWRLGEHGAAEDSAD